MNDFLLSYFIIAASGVSIVVTLFLIFGLMAFLKRARPKARFQKIFAFFPVMIKNKTVWLKFYYQYQEYSAGMVLGGTIKAHYSEDGKVWWTGSGSFFPSYKTLWVGTKKFSYREYLKSHNWKSVKQTKIDEIKKVKNMNDFFGFEDCP